MKAIFSIARLGVLGLFLSAGCGGGGFDGILKEMEGFKDKMCACKDKACAEKVKGEMEAFIMKAAKDMGDKKPSKEQDEKFDKLDDAMDACEEKLTAPTP